MNYLYINTCNLKFLKYYLSNSIDESRLEEMRYEYSSKGEKKEIIIWILKS